MLIDFLTERQLFSQEGLGITVLFYVVAAGVALLLRRVGQVRAAKKYDSDSPSLGNVLLKDIPSALWGIVFFLLTGCLKGSLRETDKTQSKETNRKIFFGGLLFVFFGFAASVVLFLLFQVLQAALGGSAWGYAFLCAKALTGAHLSLILFSLLPLPNSDAETFLRAKEFGAKGIIFRQDGTWPFFLYSVLGLLLACITVPLSNGTVGSLSGILTLFPILLMGG